MTSIPAWAEPLTAYGLPSFDRTVQTLSGVQPQWQGMYADLIARAAQAGIPLVAVSGKRTPEEQTALYNSGRGVTSVSGDRSYHVHGAAVDLVPASVLGASDWSPDDPVWGQFGDIVSGIPGFEWGGNWQSRYDPSHVQVRGGRPGSGAAPTVQQQPTMSAPAMAALAPAAGSGSGGSEMASGGLLGVPMQPPPMRQGFFGGLLGIEPDPEQGFFGGLLNPQGEGDRQANMRMAAALLQASAPSTDPRSGSLAYGIGSALDGYSQGRESGAKADERQRRARALEAFAGGAGGAGDPQMAALAAASPELYAQGMMQQAFAEPPGPINAGGGLFLDPITLEPLADYRQTERGPNTAGLPVGFMWDPTGTQAVPIPGVAAKPEDTTSLQQNLIAAGFVPGTPEYQTEMLRLMQPASGATVNVDTTGAGGDPANIGLREMQKGLGGALATTYSTMMDGGRQAGVMLGDINQLEALLAQSPQGTLAPMLTEIGGLAQSLGIDVGDIDPSSSQAVSSIIARIVPGLRPPGSGTTSDRDLALFTQSLPALSNTPQGNATIVAVLRAMAERRAQEGQIATQVATGAMTPAKAQQVLANLGPYISPDLAQAIAGASQGDMSGIPVYSGSNPMTPVHVSSEADFLALPSGATAVTDDGTVLTRP